MDSPGEICTVLHIDACSFQRKTTEQSASRFWACADMRWISKFPDEQEWLLVPLNLGAYSFSQLRCLTHHELLQVPAALKSGHVKPFVMQQCVSNPNWFSEA